MMATRTKKTRCRNGKKNESEMTTIKVFPGVTECKETRSFVGGAEEEEGDLCPSRQRGQASLLSERRERETDQLQLS